MASLESDGLWEEGLCIDERFTLEEKIGRAEAVIWRGRDIASGNRVLILEHSRLRLTGEHEARQREAEAVSRLTCEQHIPVLGVGEWEGKSYVVTEDVEGETVEHVSRGFRNHILEEGIIIAVARDVLHALIAAEEIGVVHGDVCTSTVFLCDDGGARLLFLAQARAAVAIREVDLLAHHAPEQVLGRTIDNRTDVWAVGAMMLRLSSRHAPATNESAAVADEGAGGLSPAATSVVKRAMEHNPASRYASARAMLDALPAPHPPAARAPVGQAPAEPPARRDAAPALERAADGFVLHPAFPPTLSALSARRTSAAGGSPVASLVSAPVPAGEAAHGAGAARGSLGLVVTREEPPHRVVEVLALCDADGVAQGLPGCRNPAVQPGDVLEAVGGVPVAHAPFSEVAALLAGPAGSLIDMHFARQSDWGAPRRIAVTALRHLRPLPAAAAKPAPPLAVPLAGAVPRVDPGAAWDVPVPQASRTSPGVSPAAAPGVGAEWRARPGGWGAGPRGDLSVAPSGPGSLPGAFESIQDAVRAAKPGATVTIEQGVYVESLELRAPVTLRAAAGAHVTIVSQGGVPAVVVHAEGVTLAGLTLSQRGGDATLRGRGTVRCVSVLAGHASLCDCSVYSDKGVGVAVLDAATAELVQCALQGSGKCGALAMDGAALKLVSCVVSHNLTYGLVAQRAALTAVRCEVRSNGGVGVLVHRPGADARLEDCLVGEHAEMGVAVQDGGHVKLERVELRRNRHAGVYGDGAGCWLSVWRCRVEESGVRGVGVQAGAAIELAESTVSGNAQEGVFVSGRGSRCMVQGGEVSGNGRGLVVQ